MMPPVYVIDTETSTTHFTPYVDGHIVEIGITKVDLEEGTVEPFFDCLINDPWAKESAWVFQNTTITPKMVAKAVPSKRVDKYLSYMMDGAHVTAYNVEFDRLMMYRDLTRTAKVIKWCDCLMELSAQIDEIPKRHGGNSRYPKAEDTYNALCPNDPAMINGKEEHRALSDATMESYILLALYEKGIFRGI